MTNSIFLAFMRNLSALIFRWKDHGWVVETSHCADEFAQRINLGSFGLDIICDVDQTTRREFMSVWESSHRHFLDNGLRHSTVIDNACIVLGTTNEKQQIAGTVVSKG